MASETGNIGRKYKRCKRDGGEAMRLPSIEAFAELDVAGSDEAEQIAEHYKEDTQPD